MKKIKEVAFNAVMYRGTSIAIQLAMVSIIFGLATNWKVVAACNLVCFIWYMFYHMLFINVKRALNGKYDVKPRFTAYCSHPIRGSKGDKATKEEQIANSERARATCMKIRKLIPELDIYCPGDAEKFVYQTYAKGWLTDSQILDIDCLIETECDFLMVYEFDKLGKGCFVEIDAAINAGMPIFQFRELNRKTIRRLRKFLKLLSS